MCVNCCLSLSAKKRRERASKQIFVLFYSKKSKKENAKQSIMKSLSLAIVFSCCCCFYCFLLLIDNLLQFFIFGFLLFLVPAACLTDSDAIDFGPAITTITITFTEFTKVHYTGVRISKHHLAVKSPDFEAWSNNDLISVHSISYLL